MNKDKDSVQFLATASLLTVVLYFIPFAGFITYPFRLFVTFIHEAGHAVAALLTFGSVKSIVLHADASGLTYTRGGMGLVISSAGYLASTVYGACLLVFGKQGARAKGILALTAAGILALTVLYVQGIFSWIVGIGLAVALAFVASALSSRTAHFVLSFLAVQCCLNALYDLNTLFFLSAVTNTPNDARNMQSYTGIPAILWAVAWIALSLMVLFRALKSYARQS